MMTPPRRPVFRPRGASCPQPASPATLRSYGVQQQQQQAFTALQAGLQALSAPSPRLPAQPRVPASVVPEKCDLEVSTSTFRSWRRSMEGWLHLNRWLPSEAAIHIRLLCVPALQRALDARFSAARWGALSPDEALDAISKIVVRASNQAVCWSEFFCDVQAPDEPIREYFLRCSQKAMDCQFECPRCNSDLAEYMLLRKLITGLGDPALRREVFQYGNVFTSVDELRFHCSTFEAAQRDAGPGKGFRGPPMELAGTDVDDVTPAVATASQASPPARHAHPPTRRPCGNCGGLHAPERTSCPARTMSCNDCGKLGHLKRCCRSNKKRPEDRGVTHPVTGAVVAEARLTRQPLLSVDVSRPSDKVARSTMAIADTGAQVCVAGPALLSSLALKPALLQRRAGLRDLANVHLRSLGSAPCRVSLLGRSTVQEVYFIEAVQHLYLSLAACKDLGLVHGEFPHHPPMVAATGGEDVGDVCLPTRPTVLPIQPLEENVMRLEEWLLHHFSCTTFNTERYPLPVMAGTPHHIHVAPGAKPHACHTPASIPRHWEDEVKRQLEEDVRRDVIQPVPAGEATEWCSRMVVVAKKSGSPRRTVDYQKLNAACLRETHHTPTPFDMVSGVPLHSYKTVADAYWGFHQVELDPESRRLTTFITPWGRYQYRRTPMGHCSASDAYTRRFDDAIQGVPRRHKCVDDTLLHDSSVEGAFWHTYDFLELCAMKGITLKPEKFMFCRKEVEFVGFELGWDSYKPSEDRLAAIRSFKMPDQPSLTDIRSWHGFVNQLAPFLATAPIMEPFRELLKKPAGKKVFWDAQLQLAFHQAQDIICQLAKDGLVYYDKTRPTAAVTDWSRDGIGFVILQQYCLCSSSDAPFCCKGGWRLAMCGSRHLTPAEAGYAAVEGEALAVAWCLRKARLFLLGCPNLVLVTDHCPLVKFLGDRALTDIVNPRLFRLKEKTLAYQFTVRYLPGKRNCAADFLSRYPSLRAPPDVADEDQDEDLTVAMVAATVAALDDSGCVTLDEDGVLTAAMEDPVYQLLVAKVLANDWCPQRAQEMACLRPFFGVRDRLSVSRGLVAYTFDQGSVRLVIPEALRHRVAAHLHAGHQGLDSMLRRARHTVYWPGMEGDLQFRRDSCVTCDTHAPSQPAQPLLLTPSPDYPFQQTVVDMFQLDGHMYLAYADRLTGWLEVAHFPGSTSSGRIMAKLRAYFTRWGAPEQISTDGGTNLTSEEMTTFFKRWGVAVRLSSAHYPQSNGRAEAAVKTAKRVLRNNTGLDGSLDDDRASLALLQYLNTPLHGGDKSPAQLATGRQLRDGVPTAKQNYKINQHWRRTLRRRELQLARSHDRVRLVRGGSPRSPLVPGALVRVQNQVSREWDRAGTVLQALSNRQYTVRLEGSGRISLRTRDHLREVSSSPPLAHAARPPAVPDGVAPSTPPPAAPVPGRPRRRVAKPGWLADFV